MACLSGGNQQKVLVGKYLTSKLDVLLLSDVTRGIDVGTKAELFELLRGLVESGLGAFGTPRMSRNSPTFVTG